MEKSYAMFGIFAGILVILGFITVFGIAPEVSEVVLRTGRGDSIGLILFESFLLSILMFLVGLPFSKLFFKNLGIYERVFTSFMVSFLFYGWFYIITYLWRGLMELYLFEGQLMFWWTVVMAVIGYTGVWWKGGDIDV